MTAVSVRAAVLSLVCLAAVVCVAAPAGAQVAPTVSIRVFGEVTVERFAAGNTFDAVFGHATQPFFGGGVQMTIHDRAYIDLTASRFRNTGDRVFRDANGTVFNLGIPLVATLTPIEVAGGYRFHPRRYWWLVPYVGAGVGWYRYEESSDFSAPGENVDTRHAGFVAHGGAEFRIHKWVGLAADLQYTHIAGILDAGGISADVNENDLGGVAGRIKIVVGR